MEATAPIGRRYIAVGLVTKLIEQWQEIGVFPLGLANYLGQAFGAMVHLIPLPKQQIENVLVELRAVARQLASGKKAMVIRNGFFSYRWSQIFEMGRIPAGETVLKAQRQADGAFAPVPLDQAVERIRAERPDVVFAPHVETASGMILPDAYLRGIADAVHAHGGLFVLDCIASGCVWVDMQASGVDVLLSAPQKGWSSQPCAGLVMLNEAALERVRSCQSSSFALDLGKWLTIMEAYLNGGHAYHATMPTDALRAFHRAMQDTRSAGFETLRAAQWEQGNAVRAMLAARGVRSVAADGFAAPGVVFPAAS